MQSHLPGFYAIDTKPGADVHFFFMRRVPDHLRIPRQSDR
jgi:hypothetical protein